MCNTIHLTTMKNTIYIFAIIILGGLLFSCAGSNSLVKTDFDKDVDFTKFKTFYWAEDIDNNKEGHPLLNNSLNTKRIKAAIASEMEGRGYVLSSENPDLLVNFNIVLEEKTEYRTVPNTMGYRYWMGRDDVRPYKYKEGTLIIDLVDQDEKQLVWQGYSSGIMKEKARAIEESIRASISLIFSEYRYRAS